MVDAGPSVGLEFQPQAVQAGGFRSPVDSRSRYQPLLKAWPWAGMLATAGYAIVGAWRPTTEGHAASGAVLTVLLGSLATATVLLQPVSAELDAARRSRRLLGVAWSLWTLAESYRAIGWALSGVPPGVPSIADLLRLSGYLSFLAAVVTYSSSAAGRYGRLRDFLDTTIMLTAGTALSWLVIVRPVSMALPANPVLLLWTSIAPTFNVVLLLIVTRLALTTEPARGARGFGTLVGALLALLVSDLARGYLGLGGEIAMPAIVESGWGFAACLTGFLPEQLPRRQAEAAGEVPTARSLRQRADAVLPVALTYAVVGFTLLNWRLASVIDWAGVGAAVALSLLLVARQGVLGGQSEMRQFAALVNASGDMAFVALGDGTLRLVNPAVTQALGAETPPKMLGEFVSSPEPSPAFLLDACQAGWSGEVELRRSDGSVFPASLNLRPVWDERLARALLVGTAHNLTHIREREDDLRAALSQVAVARSDLEALNAVLESRVEERTHELEDSVERLRRMNLELQELGRLKTEFVTLVSHELRAPLTTIRAGIELLLAAHPDLGQGVRERLELVAGETDRLGTFVEAILDLSALEAGRFPLRMAPTDLRASIERVVARVPPPDGGSGIVVSLPKDLPEVMVDERALESVLFHLIDNALKYAPGAPVQVGARAEPGGVWVSVTDDGPGIPPEERERVFEMFHRLDARDAREVYGHGLGLHLARQLLEAMGGGIQAEAPPGGGTRITFWIPTVPGADAACAAPGLA